MTRTEVQELVDDLGAEITTWNTTHGSTVDPPPSAREQLKGIEQNLLYWNTMLKFFDYVLTEQTKLLTKEQLCERKFFFRIDDLLEWLLSQPPINISQRPYLVELNDQLAKVQNARDALSDRYESITYLRKRYESSWRDIQQLWISFNDAKSQDRAVGKLLQTCPDVLAIRSKLSDLESLESAMELEWRHIMQNSVEIRAQASMLQDSTRGGPGGGLSAEYRRQAESVYDRPTESAPVPETDSSEPSISTDLRDPFSGYNL